MLIAIQCTSLGLAASPVCARCVLKLHRLVMKLATENKHCLIKYGVSKNILFTQFLLHQSFRCKIPVLLVIYGAILDVIGFG